MKLGKRIVAGVLAGVMAVSLGLVPAGTVRAEEMALKVVDEVVTEDDESGVLEDKAVSVPESGVPDGTEDNAAGELEDGVSDKSEDKTLDEDEPKDESTESEDQEETVAEEKDGEPDQEPTGSVEEEKGSETCDDNDAQPDVVAEPQEMQQSVKVAEQAEGTTFGKDWIFEADGKLTIQSDAGMADWGYAGKDDYGEKIVSVEIKAGVTSVEEYAFFNCDNLASITIPSSVTDIGEYAFFHCSSLASISFQPGVTKIGNDSFNGCSSLKSITLPSGVTDIGAGAFWDCSGLTSIALPASVTDIGDHAFRKCKSLTDIEIPTGVKSIGGAVFSGCSSLVGITLPSGVTSIGAYMFEDCSSLAEIELPIGMTIIEGGTFDSCKSLTNIEIPTSVKSIGGDAFNGCSSLTGIEIPASVDGIGWGAFNGCSSLESVTMQGNTPPTLGIANEGTGKTGVFEGCKFVTDNMQGIKVPWGKTEIYKNVWTEWEDYITDESLIASGTGWLLDVDGKLTIQSDAGMEKWWKNSRENYIEKVESVEIRAGVTSILGDSSTGSFSECKNLTSVTIPVSVTNIGESAFLGCSNLKDVNLPSGVARIGADAFRRCSRLTNITLPASVTSVGASAFWGCSSLTGITLPVGMTSIEPGVFYMCSNLTDITLPASITSIGEAAFWGCSSLTGITLPDSVISIEASAFRGCSSLTGITLPTGVTNIESNLFNGCSGLTSITLPTDVTSVGGYAFKDCSSLTNIALPKGLTSIEESVFSGCSSLTSIELPSGITGIGPNAFQNCESLTGIEFPFSVTSIGGYAFSGCSSLTNMTIPAGVTGIKNGLFSECSSLTSITMPTGVTSIGRDAFMDCSSLTSIMLPASVTSIGVSAFSGCSSLENVTIRGEKPPKLFINSATGKTCIFDSCKFVKNNAQGIQVPIGAVEDYKAAWTEWADYITKGSESVDIIIASGIDWTIDVDGKLTIRSDAGMKDWWNVGREKYREKVVSIEIQAGVTSILGDSFSGSFSDCKYLTSITIPDSVTSIKGCAFSDCSNLKDVTIPSGVASIGYAAFCNCNSLTSIKLPASLTSIGERVFRGCSSLTSIELPAGLTSIEAGMLDGCSSLTGIRIPTGVTKIGSSAFYNCSSLTSIELPSGVTNIGWGAFRGCSSLASMTIPSGVTSIEEWAFYSCNSLESVTMQANTPPKLGAANEDTGKSSVFNLCKFVTDNTKGIKVPLGTTEVYKTAWTEWKDYIEEDIVQTDGIDWTLDAGGKLTIKSDAGMEDWRKVGRKDHSEKVVSVEIQVGVTSIGESVFFDCGSLTSITVPDSVTSIEGSAFYNCSSLKNVTIPAGVTSIGRDAFSGCSSLTNITIPNGVTSIADAVFASCSSLTSITIPSSVTSIGSSAFFNCRSLANITIPTGVTSIGGHAFLGCSSLTSVTIPTGVTIIDSDTFFNCSSLTNITIPSSVTSIWSFAFGGCSSLTSITLPSGVTSIGEYAFMGCNSLNSITLPSGVTRIGSRAFDGCRSLKSVKLQGTTPPTLSVANEDIGKTYVFNSCKFVTDNTKGIKVPVGTAEAYKFAWTEWADYIAESSELTDEEKVGIAKGAVEVALAGIQVSNTTTKESLEATIEDAIKAALAEMDVSGDDVAIVVEDFTKTDATINIGGSISGTIKITSGTESADVPVYKTIDKLEVTPADKVAAARSTVEEAVREAVDTALAGITVTNNNAEETAAKMKEVIPDAIVGALEEAGVSTDEVLVGEVDIEIKLAETDNEGSINISIPLISKEDAGQTDSVIVQVPITNLGGEDDSSKDAETAQKMVEDALKEITATNKTTKEDILAALKEELGDKAAVEDIEKFEKQDATQEKPGSISLSVKVTIHGKTVITNVTLPIAQLSRKTGVYVRFTDYFELNGSTPRYKYTGTAIKPMVEVYNNETLLTPGMDYMIGYKNNTKVGTTAALTVKGKGSFSGTANVVNFAIINADIEQDTTHPTEMTVVVNTKVAPVIMNGTKKLTTKDYQLEGAGLANGKYAAATGERNPNTLTVKGIGSYAGSSFEIKVRVIEKSAAKKLAVMVDKNFKPVYSGNALNVSTLIRGTQGGEGAITVTDAKDRTKILKEGTDFSVLCTSSLSNAGNVKFTVTGMGEYTGSVNKSFKISPLKVGDSRKFSVTFDESKVYEYKPSGTTVDDLVVTYLGETNSKEDDKILTQGVDYKVTYSNHKKVSGTKDAALKVTFLGNYKGSGAVSRNFKVAAAKLTEANTKVIVPDQVYTSGKRAYKSTPIVTVDGATIKASNYTVSYAWATEAEAGNEAKYISDNQVKVTLAQGDTYAKVKVTITPKQTGSYTLAEGAVLTGEYYVRKADNAVNLSKAKVTFLNKAGIQLKALEYNGNAFYTPTGNRPETGYAADDLNAVYVKVAVGGVEVDPGLYDLIWINATEKGKATVVIRGKGIDTGNGLAVGSKNQTINIKAMALKGKTLQFFMENTVNAIDSLKSIF